MYGLDTVNLYVGEELDRYAFGDDHPWCPGRQRSFLDEARRLGLDRRVDIRPPVMATRELLETFHTAEMVDRVEKMTAAGEGFLDERRDTPALPGLFEAASFVVGTTVQAVDDLMAERCRRAFVPLGGLHHAGRESSSGFCIFNDIGVAIERLLKHYNLNSVAYVDIDAHHGDGVYYAFESVPELWFADIHEDGSYLYPGTGDILERGIGDAEGTKLNLPMQPNSDDGEFLHAWDMVERFLYKVRPDFILFVCGADALSSDPLSHLNYTSRAYAHATRSLTTLAEDCCEGRILALGGGGYSPEGIAQGWSAVLESLIDVPFGRTTSLMA